MKKRAMTLLLAALVFAMPQTVMALEGAVGMDEAVTYEPAPYYMEDVFAPRMAENILLDFPEDYPNTHVNTGNQAEDIAAIALTQVGYKEAGENHTKYNAWFFGADRPESWCSIFISWCADQAGIPASILAKTGMASGYSVANMTKNSFGGVPYAFGTTTPRVGDIAYIASSGEVSNHVGLVTHVDSDYIYTVEGNASDTVAQRRYSRPTGYQSYGMNIDSPVIHILFFARPRYEGAESEPDTEPELPPFVDVVPGAYYEQAVAWARREKITGGISDTEFGPEVTCTRAQVVTFLWRAAGSPEPHDGDDSFTDLEKGSYYEKAVLWAKQQGIADGTSDTTFAPETECTRGQVVTFLWRAAGRPYVPQYYRPFHDVPSGSYYDQPSLWAVQNGITRGTSAAEFSPDAVCTRGQVVTFLYRYASE